ncbi:MAG TPA: cysteine desulfurase-like protein [Acidimicrobiia bacterium]|nr:cysteine desulfurase-like protein [Acidimicrobiia bacterium]HIL46297.1 cysteine desulfurase-like protein [Acidimicrobiia bacterium]
MVNARRVLALLNMNTLNVPKTRFPGLSNGWARFDGPAGTQMVDSSIEAMADWQRSGNNANTHGSFPAAQACDDLVDEVSATMAQLLGADAEGMIFGPSTTSNLMSLTRAIGATLRPGDEIICTTLDHDANVAPWLLAAADAGAVVRMAEFDGATGRLAPQAVGDLLTDRTRWVAVTGGSNAIGTMPDIAAITDLAHAAGALVAVDGVHRTPHRVTDVGAIGCDAYATSPYKWYGPHAGVLWLSPELRDVLPAYKVRPAPETGGGRWQHGTPSYETLAGINAAAQFLLTTGMDNIAAHENQVFARLVGGLYDLPGVRVLGSTGPDDLAERAPTLMLMVEGQAPLSVAEHLARAQVAVWDGHNYAVGAMEPLGLHHEEGAVRAGVTAYITDQDVDRLLSAVASL